MTAATALKGGPLAKLAGQWNTDPHFISFCQTHFQRTDVRELILNVCGITSRRELDHSAQAAQIFHTMFRLPFLAYHNTKTKAPAAQTA